MFVSDVFPVLNVCFGAQRCCIDAQNYLFLHAGHAKLPRMCSLRFIRDGDDEPLCVCADNEYN